MTDRARRQKATGTRPTPSLVPPALLRHASWRDCLLALAALLVAVSALGMEPLCDSELGESSRMVQHFYQVIALDGMRASDGRCFLRGLDLELGKMCLYVITPMPAGLKVERHEYRRGHDRPADRH